MVGAPLPAGLAPLNEEEEDPYGLKTVPPPAGFVAPVEPPPPVPQPGAAPTGDFDYNMVPLPPPVAQPPVAPAPATATVAPADERPTEFGTQDPTKARTLGQGIVHDVLQEEGKPYSGPASETAGPDSDRWGTPGWDCSSLVSGVFAKQGVKLTPYTDAAYDQTYAVAAEDQRAGDIVFFKYEDKTQPNTVYPHMGIYLGDGWMADASYANGKVVVRKMLDKPFEIRRPTALRGKP